AVERDRERERLLARLAQDLRAPVAELPERVAALQARVQELQEEVKKAREQGSKVDVDALVAEARQVGPARLVAQVLPEVDRDTLAHLADQIVARLGEGAAVLGTQTDGKVALVAKVSEGLVAQGGHAGQLIKRVAEACGGGGGGRPHFAQAGARDADKLPAALDLAAEVLAEQLGVEGE
ncbi:MAG: alanine--tRNA ligase, partial [Armatimonadetes bacterium]|nr:alanine--tRNA ligase [Armatimonadota bacterium]